DYVERSNSLPKGIQFAPSRAECLAQKSTPSNRGELRQVRSQWSLTRGPPRLKTNRSRPRIRKPRLHVREYHWDFDIFAPEKAESFVATLGLCPSPVRQDLQAQAIINRYS